MLGFDVLSPEAPLGRRIFLEASAGTGKTFALEHLVARFLLESEGPELKEILLVTFTKAATAELRYRIRHHLGHMLHTLFSPSAFPYVLAKQKEGEQALLLAQKKIKRALANFDEAPIFTIHGFCFRALQEQGLEGGLSLGQAEEGTPVSFLQRLVKDFLRSQVKEENVTSFQIDRLLRTHRYSIEELTVRLSELVSWRLPIEGGEKAAILLNTYREETERLKEKYSVSDEKLVEDLLSLAIGYGGFCDRQKKMKADAKEAIQSFARHFCEGILDPFFLEFSPENRLKRSNQPFLHYVGLLEEMQKTLLPILIKYSDPLYIEAQVAEEARVWVEGKIQKEGHLFFEDLIRHMSRKVEDPLFAGQVRKKYKAVLIDEFQDTDIEQWKIFSSLFSHPSFEGRLCIVGDPKQSIYRFRNADLYTYLRAKETFPKEACFSLDTNFRSTPSLVKALNALFLQAEGCFPLPRWNGSLPYHEVKPGIKEEWKGADGKHALHVCVANEESAFYPFLGDEILSLHAQEELPFSRCAILVKDRFQADKVRSYLHTRSIPAMTKRSRILMETAAFALFEDLLKAALSFQDQNALKTVLGSPLFSEGFEWIKCMPLEIFKEFHDLHLTLKHEGILPFFNLLMEKEGRREKLLRQEGGAELYLDMRQLAELLASENLPAEHLLPFFETLKSQSGEECERYKALQHDLEDAVQILTIHVSKGLEFDVVFPLGLILASSFRKEMVRDDERHLLTLSEEKRQMHTQECDAEKMRQFYVALTRAKKRLYLPILENEKKKEVFSPMRLFLEKSLKGRTLADFAASLGASYSSVENAPMQVKQMCPTILPSLIPPLPASCTWTPLSIHSYSSLSSLSSQRLKEWNQDSLEEKKENTPVPPRMPAGPAVGHLLHRLFEEIPFEIAFTLRHPRDFLFFVKPFLESTLLEGWEVEVSHMLFAVFHAPLPCEEGAFPLSAVNPKKIFKEMEFLYSTSEPHGFLKGFVDLFFEHQGRYYLIDWKSNDLINYTPESLQKAMHEHNYFLQASIYRSALERYIKKFNSRLEWGGAYYIFLRGGSEGIYKI